MWAHELWSWDVWPCTASPTAFVRSLKRELRKRRLQALGDVLIKNSKLTHSVFQAKQWKWIVSQPSENQATRQQASAKVTLRFFWLQFSLKHLSISVVADFLYCAQYTNAVKHHFPFWLFFILYSSIRLNFLFSAMFDFLSNVLNTL